MKVAAELPPASVVMAECNDWGDESWTVDCPCGVNYDDGEEMVDCDECGVWVHTSCCRISKGHTSYVCDKCKTKKRKKESDESEVAQLLLDLPTKATALDSRSHPPPEKPLPHRTPQELFMEERAHTQGIPGGDPLLFVGASKVFSRQLWIYTGYIRKPLHLHRKDAPPPLRSCELVPKGGKVATAMDKSDSIQHVDVDLEQIGIDLENFQHRQGPPPKERHEKRDAKKSGSKHQRHKTTPKEESRGYHHSKRQREESGQKESGATRRRARTTTSDGGLTQSDEAARKPTAATAAAGVVTSKSTKSTPRNHRRKSSPEKYDGRLSNSFKNESHSAQEPGSQGQSSNQEWSKLSDLCRIASNEKPDDLLKEREESAARAKSATPFSIVADIRKNLRKEQHWEEEDTVSEKDVEMMKSIAASRQLVSLRGSVLTPEKEQGSILMDRNEPSESEVSHHSVKDPPTPNKQTADLHMLEISPRHCARETAGDGVLGGRLEDNNDNLPLLGQSLSPSTKQEASEVGTSIFMKQPTNLQKLHKISENSQSNAIKFLHRSSKEDSGGEVHTYLESSEKLALEQLSKSEDEPLPVIEAKNQSSKSKVEELKPSSASLPQQEANLNTRAAHSGPPPSLVVKTGESSSTSRPLSPSHSSSFLFVPSLTSATLKPQTCVSSSPAEKSGNGVVIVPKGGVVAAAAVSNSKHFTSAKTVLSSKQRARSITNSLESEKALSARVPSPPVSAEPIGLTRPTSSRESAKHSAPAPQGKSVTASKLSHHPKEQDSHISLKLTSQSHAKQDISSGGEMLEQGALPQSRVTSPLRIKQSSSRMNHKAERMGAPIEPSKQTHHHHPEVNADWQNTITSSAPPALNDEELAMLLHQELNSSPRVHRVAKARQYGTNIQLGSSSAPKGSLKRSSSASLSSSSNVGYSGSKKKARDDLSREGLRGTLLCTDESKKVEMSSMKRLDDGRVSSGSSRDALDGTATLPEIATSSTTECTNNQHLPLSSILEVQSVSDISGGNDSLEGGERKSSADDVITLPVLIEEILNEKGIDASYDYICEATLPHWQKLRKPNGERYAYASHRQAVLDCLRNRSAWCHLIDRGPKSNLGWRRRKEGLSVDSENEEMADTKIAHINEAEDGKHGRCSIGSDMGHSESFGICDKKMKEVDVAVPEDIPRGKRKARQRRRPSKGAKFSPAKAEGLEDEREVLLCPTSDDDDDDDDDDVDDDGDDDDDGDGNHDDEACSNYSEDDRMMDDHSEKAKVAGRWHGSSVDSEDELDL